MSFKEFLKIECEQEGILLPGDFDFITDGEELFTTTVLEQYDILNYRDEYLAYCEKNGITPDIDLDLDTLV